MTNIQDSILIAKIVAVQGIKGQFRVDVYSDAPDNIKKYEELHLKNGDKIELKYDFIRGSQMIARIDGVRSRNDAEKLVGKEIYVKKSDLEQLDDNEFYIDDLDGLKVFDNTSKQEIGVVHAVHDFGAGAIIEVKYSNRQKNIYEMFSFNDETFPEIDFENDRIFLNIPETEEVEL